MKLIFALSLLFSIIALPALGALTDADLDKIRLIVNDSEKRIKAEMKADIAVLRAEMKTDIAAVRSDMKTEFAAVRAEMKSELDPIKSDIRTLSTEVASLNGRVSGIERMMTWLMALIIVAVGLPQIIIAWRSRKDRALEKRIDVLTEEIETLKQRHTVSP